MKTMSLSPPFLDPEYSQPEFWGEVSAFGEGSTQFGPYKYVVLKAVIKHAQLGDRTATVKIKIGQQSEGNLYLLGIEHLSELIGRSVKFTRMSGEIEGQLRKWFVACQVKEAKVPKESTKK